MQAAEASASDGQKGAVMLQISLFATVLPVSLSVCVLSEVHLPAVSQWWVSSSAWFWMALLSGREQNYVNPSIHAAHIILCVCLTVFSVHVTSLQSRLTQILFKENVGVVESNKFPEYRRNPRKSRLVWHENIKARWEVLYLKSETAGKLHGFVWQFPHLWLCFKK